MATSIAPPDVRLTGPSGPGGPRVPRGGGGRWGGYPGGLPVGTYRFGMVLGLASISMLFLGFTSAYIVRQGLPNMEPVPLPPILFVNTAVLVMSSLTLEIARRALKTAGGAHRTWLGVTLALGVLFVAGQLVAWRQLVAAGVYLGSTPHSAFFYTLTGAHAAHLFGGVVALAFLVGRARREIMPRARLARWVGVTALYWHFMDGLWAYLLVLLFAWR